MAKTIFVSYNAHNSRNISYKVLLMLFLYNTVLFLCNTSKKFLTNFLNVVYYVYMRKKRSDRNHVIYQVTCVDTGDTYIGLTVALGQAYLKSVKIRWQKHVSRAICEDKDWNLCRALRELSDCEWRYEVLDVVRGRKNAHQTEREYIAVYEPSLNTF